MVDHGGVGRNLGLPCAQSFNLDRAFNTQPHTNVIQVTKDPEVPPTRARKDVWIISNYFTILLLAFLFLSECFAILEWVLCHSWVSATAYVCLEYVAILVTWRTLCCYILLCCVLVDFHNLFYCVLLYGVFFVICWHIFCYMLLHDVICFNVLRYAAICVLMLLCVMFYVAIWFNIGICAALCCYIHIYIYVAIGYYKLLCDVSCFNMLLFGVV